MSDTEKPVKLVIFELIFNWNAQNIREMGWRKKKTNSKQTT